ncbi:MAG TPA: plastocyanin/azurin family copper-binding protein [Candidatus Saccharimonadales bacterium]|nr:plastocyanin/azurin family copper-binding protein [Candidatus Saccharimonadales bacterium]
MRTIGLLALILSASLAVGACSGGSASPVPSTAGTGSTSGAVQIKNLAFGPATITVAIGGSVTWTNADSIAHTVTFDDTSVKSSDNINSGQTYQVTFSKAGTFTYHCSIHPTMLGTVTVS